MHIQNVRNWLASVASVLMRFLDFMTLKKHVIFFRPKAPRCFFIFIEKSVADSRNYLVKTLDLFLIFH